MIQYALKRISTNEYIGCGNGPDGYGTSTELSSDNLHDTKKDAVDHIDWMRYWAKTPDCGPKVKLAYDDVIQLIEVKVSYETASINY